MYTRHPPKQLQSRSAGPNTRCQKCLKFGHYTYECSNPQPYQARPSRTQQLEKGKLGREKPSVELPEEFKKEARVGLADRILQAKEDERKRLKAIEDKKAGKTKSSARTSRKARESSSSESESDSDSSASSSSTPRAPRRKRPYTSSSESTPSRSAPSPPRRRARSSSGSASPPPRRRRSLSDGRRRSRSPVSRPRADSRDRRD